MADKKIADELREWLKRELPTQVEEGYAIADRIDEAHDKATLAQYNKGTEVATKQLIAEKTDEWLAGHGLCRLPVDADGVPLRIDDRVYTGDGSMWYVGAVCGRNKDWVLLYAESDRNDWFNGDWFAADSVRHCQPTPAERIRAWVAKARNDEHMDLRELEAIASEMEKSDGE